MSPQARLLPLIALLLLPLLSGCIYSRELSQTRRDIERTYDVDFDHNLTVNLGPVSLRTLSWLTGLVPEDEAQMAHSYLRDVRRVKVGVYELEPGSSLEGQDLPALRRFQRDRWEVAVRVREEHGELVWVLYREHRETVRDLYVLVLNDDELVMARVSGRLDRLFQRILADHGSLTAWNEW